ncbi:MAG: hypothetical protein ACYC1M_19545 [Armatimonadota bacterium]
MITRRATYQVKTYCIRTALIIPLVVAGSAGAKITGVCDNCHTMHNSQQGASMQFKSSTKVERNLLRGDCLGCHGQATGQKIINTNGSQVPQVMHTDPSGDLAAGNFGYITA